MSCEISHCPEEADWQVTSMKGRKAGACDLHLDWVIRRLGAELVLVKKLHAAPSDVAVA